MKNKIINPGCRLPFLPNHFCHSTEIGAHCEGFSERKTLGSTRISSKWQRLIAGKSNWQHGLLKQQLMKYAICFFTFFICLININRVAGQDSLSVIGTWSHDYSWKDPNFKAVAGTLSYTFNADSTGILESTETVQYLSGSFQDPVTCKVKVPFKYSIIDGVLKGTTGKPTTCWCRTGLVPWRKQAKELKKSYTNSELRTQKIIFINRFSIMLNGNTFTKIE